jgi:hypothetical protein
MQDPLGCTMSQLATLTRLADVLAEKRDAYHALPRGVKLTKKTRKSAVKAYGAWTLAERRLGNALAVLGFHRWVLEGESLMVAYKGELVEVPQIINTPLATIGSRNPIVANVLRRVKSAVSGFFSRIT